MTKAEKIQAIREFNNRIREEQGKGSTGAKGKWCDFYARNYLMKKGVSSTADVRCRAADKTDFRLFYEGVYHDGESKTGAGSWKMNPASLLAIFEAELKKPVAEQRTEQEIRESLSRADVPWTEDEIFPDIDLFVVAAETEFLTEENFMDQMWVCTREQYIEMHRFTGKKGLSSSLTYDVKKGIMKIQPYITKVEDKKTGKVRYAYARLNKFYDYLVEADLPTLREFREQVRG